MFPALRWAGAGFAGFIDFKSCKERGEKERQQVKDSLRGKQRWRRARKKGSRQGRGLGLRGTANDCSGSSKKPTKEWLPTRAGI